MHQTNVAPFANMSSLIRHKEANKEKTQYNWAGKLAATHAHIKREWSAMAEYTSCASPSLQ